MEVISFRYSEFVKTLYERGYYVERYTIDLMNDEVSNIDNKIFIIPTIQRAGEDIIYVFTGTLQKIRTIGEATLFTLFLVDDKGQEYKDDDKIMLSIGRQSTGKISSLYTRNYAEWKFGTTFEKGISIDGDKFLIFQTQKSIGRFNINIYNVDLFKHKNTKEPLGDGMKWVE